MWFKVVIGVVAIKMVCSFASAVSVQENIKSLPFCPNKSETGMILVSTLDGKLSALNSSGQLKWNIETGPGPLLISNIHKLELTNNGEWIRIIPSLTGTLYKFDGSTIDPISISAETLLKSSFKYSDDLVIAGGLEVRTYGVGFNSGKLLYECSQSKCSHHEKEEMDDVLVIERSTQTVRAVEPRSGYERWNFSVGLHNIKIPQASCIQNYEFNPNITAVIPEGILSVFWENNNNKTSWQYKFNTPIVKVWTWNGTELKEVNLFIPRNMPVVHSTTIFPSIYIGMHKKQLYIHESHEMQNVLQNHVNTDIAATESTSITKIPWKPIPASSETTEDDSTALSVLNNSEYVNGNGYYLFTEHDLKQKENPLCDNNQSQLNNSLNTEDIVYDDMLSYLVTYFRYYKEFMLLVFTAIVVLYKVWIKTQPKSNEVIIIEKPVNITTPVVKSVSESTGGEYTSRFEEDYDTIQCLGRGGFGVVFEAKQKYDDCHYAIKRITLPKEKGSRNRVMREVKALAKLDHRHIVRYFTSWIEEPPFGWEEQHDKNWLELSQSENPTSIETVTKTSPTKRIKSQSISIPIEPCREPSFDSSSSVNENHDDEDDIVVFEPYDSSEAESTKDPSDNDSFVVSFQENSNSAITNAETSIDSEAGSTSAHLQKKINWKRPGRKHYSWDMSQSQTSIVLPPRKPPTYLYIQMQLCQKDSLKEWLHSNAEREYNKMLDIFLQILEAVEYVHLRKLIHRDLKPSNIFFSLDGQIKVGDFGLVKDIEESIDIEFPRRNHVISLRGHTKEVGTQLYMSPEQLKGEPYNYKVDIYSLGIILFELLVPFATGMERVKTLTDLKEQKYPEGFIKKYPAEYSLLQIMLDENPDKRLTTIGIKARKPFNRDPSNSSVDEHYSLKNIQ